MSQTTLFDGSSDISHKGHRHGHGKPTEAELKRLVAVAKEAAFCTKCALHTGRTKSVFADGNPLAPLMIIGEGPGQNEDETGIPFVGKAGQLLTQILESVGFNRAEDVYICNIVKCRPPQNRAPEPDEMEACFPYLAEQIAIIRPRLVLLAGATAVKGILKTKVGITKIRGQWFEAPEYLNLPRHQNHADFPPLLLAAQPVQRKRQPQMAHVARHQGHPQSLRRAELSASL